MNPLSKIARELTEKYFPKPFDIGDIVTHPDGRKVKIVDGKYLSNGRLSNFWYWREVLEDNSLSDKLEHGYGWYAEKENV